MKKGDLIGVVGKCSKGSRVVINRPILKTKAGKVQVLSQHGRLIWLKRDSKLITKVKAEPEISFEESLEQLNRAFAAGSDYPGMRLEDFINWLELQGWVKQGMTRDAIEFTKKIEGKFVYLEMTGVAFPGRMDMFLDIKGSKVSLAENLMKKPERVLYWEKYFTELLKEEKKNGEATLAELVNNLGKIYPETPVHVSVEAYGRRLPDGTVEIIEGTKRAIPIEEKPKS